jgi:hypothetical protein
MLAGILLWKTLPEEVCAIILSWKLDTDLKRAAETGGQVIGKSVEDENTFEPILAPELDISMLIVFLPISLYILMVY